MLTILSLCPADDTMAFHYIGNFPAVGANGITDGTANVFGPMDVGNTQKHQRFLNNVIITLKNALSIKT